MTMMCLYDEERVGRSIGLLGPVPVGWVRAAQEMPELYRSFDGIVARAEADAALRPALIADLEVAIAGAGRTPEPKLVEALRRHFVGR